MRSKFVKKYIALFTAATLMTGGTNVFAAETSQTASAEDSVIAEFDFDTDISNNGPIIGGGAKATGSYTLVNSYDGTGKALHLNADAGQSLSLTKEDGSSLLTGVKEMTVSYEAKHERTATNWILYAAPTAAAPTFQCEKYIAIVENSGVLDAERYNNSGTRPAFASAAVVNEWTHVDVVFKQTETIIYVNGDEAARQASSYALTDILGNNSICQIGKANWGNGEYVTASIDNFKIYNKALSAEEVTEQYKDFALYVDLEALTIPTSTNRSLSLPETGESGLTTITWKSNNTEIMTDDGKVTRPKEDTSVTLTATVSANGVSETKEFTVKVLKRNVESDLVTFEKELTLNVGFVYEDLVLPETIGDATVTWTTSDASVITADGKITRAVNENKEVQLNAIIQVEDKTVEKEFSLTVLAAGQDIVSYISKNPATGQAGGMKLAAEGLVGYEPLNKAQPVLYSSLGEGAFGTATIFRKADGSLGLIAADGGNNARVLIYDTEDLITYTNPRSASLLGVGTIDKLECFYDQTEAVYKVYVENKNGTYLLTSQNMEKFGIAKTATYTFKELEGVPSDAKVYAGIGLTQAEYDTIVAKFTNPYNTKVEVDQGDLVLEKGETFSTDMLPESALVSYSDGTERTLGILWDEKDLANVDVSETGTYTVSGTVGATAHYTDEEAPLILERADPFVTYNEDDGYYYFTATYPMNGGGDVTGNNRLILRRAKTIAGLADAEEVVIWYESQSEGFGRFIWAPELHKIGGSWYFISTAAVTEQGPSFDIRPFMIKCNNPDDMMNPNSWGAPVRVKAMAGDESNCVNAMSLDMTHFTAGGKDYLAWADFTQNGISCMYIATIDPTNPTQLTSRCSIITMPEFSWEKERFTVNEGPAVIKNEGKVYMAFSASGTGMEYCVGVLSADENADLLNVNNWTKTGYPIMTSADFNDEVSGPGHNSFTVDEYGNPVIVYHARPTEVHTTAGGVHNGDPLYDPCRHTFMKQVFFGEDGMPILNMTEDEYVAENYRNVTVRIVVKEGDAKALEITPPFKDEYIVGEDLDLSGVVLKVTYADGSVANVTKGYEVTGYDSDTEGVKTVTVTYEGQEVTFDVLVSKGAELPYEDVTDVDWFYDAVYYNFIEGTMTGMDETHFGPYGQLSRAQFALILYRIEGTPAVDTDKSFRDISGDEWYGPAVLWAAENGIVTGYQNGCFGPADIITREQMAVMMYRYANYLGQDTNSDASYDEFLDASSVSSFAADAMKWVIGNGIITGKDKGTKIDPQGNTARCEAAAIIQRFMK